MKGSLLQVFVPVMVYTPKVGSRVSQCRAAHPLPCQFASLRRLRSSRKHSLVPSPDNITPNNFPPQIQIPIIQHITIHVQTRCRLISVCTPIPVKLYGITLKQAPTRSQPMYVVLAGQKAHGSTQSLLIPHLSLTLPRFLVPAKTRLTINP